MDPDPHQTLLRKAGALLARRAFSRGELRDKLSAAAGDSRVEAVLDRLEQLNLLNDADYAYNFALYRIRQLGWGPAKVRDSLLRRQVAPAIVESAIKRACEEADPLAALADYARKYLGKKDTAPDLKIARRLIAHLRRRGFEEDIIMSALKRVIPAALWQRLETGE